MSERSYGRSTPSLAVPLVILTIGVVLLLDRLGIIEGSWLYRFWPLLLVAAGLSHLFRPGEGGKVSGALMVAVGALFQLSNLDLIRLDWSTAWPILLIAVGATLLWRALAEPGRTGPARLESLNEWVMFGGQTIRSDAKDFRGGRLLAMFGGFDIDLTKADMAQEEAVLEVAAIFGGVEVRAPEHWRIVPKVTPILGGFEDKTSYPKPEHPGGSKALVVKGLAMFGGIEVKN